MYCLLRMIACCVRLLLTAALTADVLGTILAILAIMSYTRGSGHAQLQSPPQAATSWSSWCKSLLWTVLAVVLIISGTLAKEVCATTFGACIAFDLLCLGEAPPRLAPSAPSGSVWSFVKRRARAVWQSRWCLLLLRWLVLCASFAAFMSWRLSAHGSVMLRPWTVLENQFAGDEVFAVSTRRCASSLTQSASHIRNAF